MPNPTLDHREFPEKSILNQSPKALSTNTANQMRLLKEELLCFPSASQCNVNTLNMLSDTWRGHDNMTGREDGSLQSTGNVGNTPGGGRCPHAQ